MGLFVANNQPCLRLNLKKRRLEPNQQPRPLGRLRLPNPKARLHLKQQRQQNPNQKGNQLRPSLSPMPSRKKQRQPSPRLMPSQKKQRPPLSPRLTPSHPLLPRPRLRKPR